MERKLTEDELKAMLKKATAAGDAELSLDDLESVNGGFSYAENGDTMTITLTETEYTKLSEYLSYPIAKQIIDANGFGDVVFSRNMTMPVEKGREVVNLLNAFAPFLQ